MRVYIVKVAGVCNTYYGPSFKEAEEMFNRSNSSAVMSYLNDNGVQIPIRSKDIKHSGVVTARLS